MAKKNPFNSSSNPFFKGDKYNAEAMNSPLDADLINVNEGRMTVNGAVNKTLMLTGLMLITTLFSYTFYNPIFMYVGIFGGMGIMFWASKSPHKSATLAPIYALLEGLFVGTISVTFASIADTTGIIFQAALLTMSLLFMMLMISKTGIIKVTEKFRAGVAMATGAVMLVYVIQFVLSFFGMSVPYLHQGGAMGIGITVAILVIACMKLLVDFDNYEKGELSKAPKYMEWYTGMGLLATLVWIYYEALHLILMLTSD